MPLYYPVPAYMKREVELLSRDWEFTRTETERMVDFFTHSHPDPEKVQLLQEIKEVNAALEKGFILGLTEKDWGRPIVHHYLIRRIVIDADHPMISPRKDYNPFRYAYEIGYPWDLVLNEYGMRRKLHWGLYHRSPDYLLIHALRQVRAGQHDHLWDGRGLNESCVYCQAPGPQAERRIQALMEQQANKTQEPPEKK